MKLTNITVTRVKVPLTEPFRISLGTITHAESAVVRLDTDEGLSGYGEGAPGVFVSGENLPGTLASLERMTPSLLGADPTDIEDIHCRMDRATAHAFCAKTAIDIACYDLLGKRSGLPVYKLLGGLSNAIDTDVTVPINPPEYMAQKAAQWVAKGFDAIKIKVGVDPDSDLQRVKAIREAVGPDVKLRVDANQAWSAKEALNMIARLDEYHLELVEQPVPAHDLEGLAFVTQNTRVPIMSDESCFTAQDALKLVERRAVDLVNIKLMKCGGLHEALRINAVCQAAGVGCMLGCMAEETNLGITAAASLGAALQNITRADLDATFSLASLPFRGGVDNTHRKTLTLSDQPGFGFLGLREEGR